MAALDADAGAEIVAAPLLLIGLGMGAPASQLGAITVSAVPESRSAVVGGLQNAAARIDGLRAALAILAFTALLAMFFTHRIPKTQPGSPER